MVHAYCEIRDSWTGWLRSGAMGRTLFERIVPEMRDLQGAERRNVDQPSVTLLSVLDYAARARQAVPTYTPLKTIDYPQPPLSAQVREACERLTTEATEAALAARRASARAYAARMTSAIERERAEEARRQKAMAEAGVTETPVEAEAATARVEARIAVYEREIRRVYDEAGLSPSLTRYFEDRLLSMIYRAKISRRALHSGFFRPLRGQTIVFLMPPGAGSIPSAR